MVQERHEMMNNHFQSFITAEFDVDGVSSSLNEEARELEVKTF
jgi:hypothetical protein